MKFAASASSALLVATLFIAPQAAFAQENDAPIELTNTSVAATYLSGAELSLSNYGNAPDLSNYRVVKGIPGDSPDAVWVIPQGAEVPTVTVSDTDGFIVTMTTAKDTPTPIPTSATKRQGGSIAAVLAKGFSWQSPTCFSRYTATNGWMDRCTQWGYVTNDGDTLKDHWVFKTYATCKSNKYSYIQTCKLADTGDSRATWEDWAPKADTSGNCRSTSVSVSSFGVGVSGSYNACDVMNITKSTTAGAFSNAFQTSSAYMTERAVQYQVSVAIKQGVLPSFGTSYAVTGYLKIG